MEQDRAQFCDTVPYLGHLVPIPGLFPQALLGSDYEKTETSQGNAQDGRRAAKAVG